MAADTGRQKLFGIHLQRAVGQLQIVAPIFQLSASQCEVLGFVRMPIFLSRNLLAPLLYQSIVCAFTITIEAWPNLFQIRYFSLLSLRLAHAGSIAG